MHTTDPSGTIHFPKSAIEGSLIERFQQQVDLYPDELAVLAPDTRWTYSELNAKANAIAGAIHGELGELRTPVGLLFDQGAHNVAAILGVLKAGCPYVPLEPSYPVSRNGAMLRSAGVSLLLTEEAHRSVGVELIGSAAQLLILPAVFSKPVGDLPKITVDPNEPAYIFFTSGSTGTPKGVVDSHRNVLHNIHRYTNALRVVPSDRLTMIQSGAFSGTVSSLFTALLNGATILPFDLRNEGFLSLARWLHDSQATIFHSVPSIFRHTVRMGGTFPAVRVVRLEGDRSVPADVALFRDAFPPHCILANGLGSTETGLSCQYQMHREEAIAGGPVPIGTPLPDMKIRLVNDRDEEVENGEIGEIEVTSEFLATGYWDDEEMTKARFLPAADPAERRFRTGDLGRTDALGRIQFLGRKDLEHKINGNRVDLHELEQAMLATGAFEQVIATTRAEASGSPVLIAYVIPKAAETIDLEQLRKQLAPRLPAFEIPTALVTLKEFPVTEHGKVDRSALPDPEPEQEAPRHEQLTADAMAMAVLWEQVLGRSVDLKDNFFDLGGDSMKAAMLCAELERNTGHRIPPTTVLAAPVFKDFLELAHARGSAGNSPMLAMRSNGSRTPIFMIDSPTGHGWQFWELVRELGDDQPFYCLTSCGQQDPWPRDTRMEDLARNAIALIRSVQPAGPIRLAGNCYGAVVAFEVAHQLEALGEPVEALFLLELGPMELPDLMPAGVAAEYQRALHRDYRKGRWSKMKRMKPGQLIRWGMTKLIQRARRIAWLSANGARAEDISLICQRALAAHRPVARAGRVDVIISEEDVQRYTDDPVRIWAGIASDVVVHRIPGPLPEMMSRPAVSTIARVLRSDQEAVPDR